MRRGFAAAAATAVVVLALSPLFGAPADAQSSGVTVTPSNFAMSPAPTPAMTTSAVSVSGHFHASGGFQPVFDWVSVNVVWAKGGAGPSQTYAYCGAPPNTQPSPTPCPPATQGTVDFDFKQNFSPPLAYNGPYTVTATGQAHDQSFLGNSAPVSATTNQISFGMAVPAPNVTNVTAAVQKDRSVNVAFDRDGSTPDVQTYWIYRKGPGEKDFHARFSTKQLASGARITVNDTGTEAAGGDYLYEIEEHRNGQSGDASSFTISDRSKSVSNKATVPDPPPGATTPPVTAPPPSNDGAPPVVKGTPSGVSRSSGFSGSSGSSAATTPTSEAVTPDPGFARGLPYAGGATPNDQNNSEGDNSAVAVTPGRHKSTNKGVLIPVAGAAVLVLGALHLRYFKQRLDEPPSNLTPIA
ncbi:MAG: hypothetical protein JO176_01315 [Acidimicrobiia bacterium]|nr:hypothetical protein [Acidimicrobiia bacterium]